jgi:hypothetical protein
VSSELQIQSFEHLNALFREKLSDHTLYRGKQFSYLKIFQHALTYEQAGADFRILKNYLHWPVWAQRALMQLKSLRHSHVKTPQLREVVLIDPARLVRDHEDTWHSIYMERATELFPPKSITVLSRKADARMRCDAVLSSIPRHYQGPDAREMELLKDISDVSQLTLKSTRWTQKQKAHILSALHVFFDDFRFYYGLFRNQPVISVVFISHYHNEGLIAALKTLGIRSVELQHGLISENDLYYQYGSEFRQGVQNGLFPDHICVYGSYWKELLLKGVEFNAANITVAGDYQWQPETKPDKQPINQVLICAQKNMHAEYVAYAQRIKPLLQKHPDWKWVIKMHPLEKNKELYRALERDGFIIVDNEQSINALLSESRIQISIYSTTFFDALGYDILNYSLQDYSIYSDYAAQMIKEKVAEPLSVDDDPVDKYLRADKKSTHRSRQEVYAPFNAEVMHRAITG